jgi:hypothetical protein
MGNKRSTLQWFKTFEKSLKSQSHNFFVLHSLMSSLVFLHRRQLWRGFSVCVEPRIELEVTWQHPSALTTELSDALNTKPIILRGFWYPSKKYIFLYPQFVKNIFFLISSTFFLSALLVHFVRTLYTNGFTFLITLLRRIFIRDLNCMFYFSAEHYVINVLALSHWVHSYFLEIGWKQMFFYIYVHILPQIRTKNHKNLVVKAHSSACF